MAGVVVGRAGTSRGRIFSCMCESGVDIPPLAGFYVVALFDSPAKNSDSLWDPITCFHSASSPLVAPVAEGEVYPTSSRSLPYAVAGA